MIFDPAAADGDVNFDFASFRLRHQIVRCIDAVFRFSSRVAFAPRLSQASSFLMFCVCVCD